MKMHSTIATLRNEHGNVLITALLLIFAASIIGATVVLISSTDLKISGNQKQETESLFTAEAGLAEAIQRMGSPDPTNVTVGGATFNAAIRDKEPYDPNWKVYIRLVNQAPTTSGSTTITGTVQNLNNANVLQYSEPNGTNDVISIEHKWKDRNGDGVRDPNEIVRYDPAKVPPENFDTGNPVDIVTVTGRSGQGKQTLQAEVTRQTLILKAMGALYTDKAVRIAGTSAFCGWNHDINTPVGTVPNQCFSYHLSDHNLPGITTTGDNIDEQGNAHDIDGNPATNTSNLNPWYSLAEVLGVTDGQLAKVLSDPDYTAPADSMNGVTYIQGDATINAGMTGHGLMYITGDARINGGFTYWGLIYIEGDLTIVGTPWVLGSVIVKGKGDYHFGAGNGAILWSKDAIDTYVDELMPMNILTWRDI